MDNPPFGWINVKHNFYQRADGVQVRHYGQGPSRPWQVLKADGRTYLRGRLYADGPFNGGVRSFATVRAAMQAADASWPLKVLPRMTAREDATLDRWD